MLHILVGVLPTFLKNPFAPSSGLKRLQVPLNTRILSFLIQKNKILIFTAVESSRFIFSLIGNLAALFLQVRCWITPNTNFLFYFGVVMRICFKT